MLLSELVFFFFFFLAFSLLNDLLNPLLEEWVASKQYWGHAASMLWLLHRWFHSLQLYKSKATHDEW